MAVYKQDRSQKDYTGNPIPRSSFFQTRHPSKLCYEINGNSIVQFKDMEKDVGTGLTLLV